jgi:hypothetical protein
MKKIALCILAVLVFLFPGCGSFVEPLLKGDAVPEGKVLIIGKVIVSPHYGRVIKDERDFIMMSMNDDLNRSVNSIDDAIDPDLGKVFYFPVSVGTKYFRVGQIMIPNGSRIGVGGSRTTYDVLRMLRNIKVTIPAKARAVYIGTITYKHNGEKATEVTVRDEQEEAMQALAKMHFRSLAPKDVVKKLAVVLNEQKN